LLSPDEKWQEVKSPDIGLALAPVVVGVPERFKPCKKSPALRANIFKINSLRGLIHRSCSYVINRGTAASKPWNELVVMISFRDQADPRGHAQGSDTRSLSREGTKRRRSILLITLADRTH